MKIRLVDFLLLVIVSAFVWFVWIDPIIRPQPPVITAGPTQSAPVIVPTQSVIQPAQPTPVIQVIELPAQPTVPVVEPRGGFQSPDDGGNTGSHEPGREDRRSNP